MICSINPASNIFIKEYQTFSHAKIKSILTQSQNSFSHWKNTSLDQRRKVLLSIAEELNNNIELHSRMITDEMGKPIVESRMEIDKCVWVLKYFAENACSFLDEKRITTDYAESYVEYKPLGVILGIMPWNFPYWQIIRFVAPALMAGNVCLVKHAPNVTGCSLLIEQLIANNCKVKDIYKALIIEEHKVKQVIESDVVKAVSLTGSEKAGSAVAMLAGKEIKKTVLELGGSDPYIVLNDANLKICSKTAINARFFNAGQSCIAAKRFLVQDRIYDEFLYNIKERISKLIVGNPMDENTQIGPLAKKEFVNKIHEYVESSISKGAVCEFGGEISGCYYYPTLLTNIKPDMDVFKEETFGPIFCVLKFSDVEEAINFANQTKYGLGGSIWSTDIKLAKDIANQIDAGSIFINDMTKSDPRLPFGGVNKSGYGKELSRYGILEFVNIKTIVVK